MKLILIALILLPFLLNCDGKPDGAPLSACSTLMPNHHGITPSKDRSPYAVSAELTENNKVKVSISSKDQGFEGFVLQARSETDRGKFVSGTFTTSQDTKTIDCFKNAKGTLTHDNSTVKKEVVTEWTPDPNVDEAVIFRATVAKSYDTFWTELDSQPITIYSDTDNSLDLMYKGCSSKTKGCFGLPNGCLDEKNCTVLLTYYSVPSGVRFSLHGYLESLSYMAVGLSEDSKMGEDSVNECIRDNSDVIARESWNEVNFTNTKTKNLLKSDYHSKYSDGLTSCSWVKPSKFETPGKDFDLENNYYHLLLATGRVTDGSLKYHHSDRVASTANFNLTEFPFKEEDDSSLEIDGIDFYSHEVPDSTEKYREVSTSAVANHTEEQGESHGSQLSFNAFYVILALLLASRGVQV